MEAWLEDGAVLEAGRELVRQGDRSTGGPREFWEELRLVFDRLGERHETALCRFRGVALDRGYIEALLEAGAARTRPIFTDYRPDWNLGSVGGDSDIWLCGARISLEDASQLEPGSSARVRLFPTALGSWVDLPIGVRIDMHEGARVLGSAVVLEVRLLWPETEKLDRVAACLEVLDVDVRRRFYERLWFELTIAARDVWSDERLSDGAQRDCLKWLNEIQHTVSGAHASADIYEPRDLLHGVRHWTGQSPGISRRVGYAIASASQHSGLDVSWDERS